MFLFTQDDDDIYNLFVKLGFTTVPYLTVSGQDLKRESKVETFFKEEDKWLVRSTEVYDS